jgi:hypothetical protein
VPALLLKLRSADSDTRYAAAAVLVRMQSSDPESVASLMSALEKEDLKFIAANYTFYIRLGQAGTEDILARALRAHGNKRMGLDYLNCGNDQLDAAAREWGADHGYTVYSEEGVYAEHQWGEGG